MSVTTSSFTVRFPEFALADADLLAAALAGVEATVADSYDTEDIRDEVVMYALADALAKGPMGRDAQMVGAEGRTTYGERLKELREAHAFLNPLRWGTTP